MTDSQSFSDTKFLTLVSAEGFEFYVSQKAASYSKMLKEMMISSEQGSFEESNKITLEDISTDVLELVCKFLHERCTKQMYMREFASLSQLDPTKPEERELAIELLLAANYMDC